MALSLRQSSIYVVINNIQHLVGGVKYLPNFLKDEILFIVSNRGYLNNAIINSLLHEQVKCFNGHESKIDSLCLKQLHKCKHLTTLILNGGEDMDNLDICSGDMVELFPCLKLLTQLTVKLCQSLTDEVVKVIVNNCTQITVLNISYCYSITDKTIELIVSLSLKSLDVSYTKITDQALYFIINGKCKSTLTELSLVKCNNLEMDQNILLENCKNLKILHTGCFSMSGGENLKQVVGWTL